MSKIDITVYTDNGFYKAQGFVLKADHDTKQNAWYCKTAEGLIDAGSIFDIIVKDDDVTLNYTGSRGKCVLDLFDWLDLNRDSLEAEGFNVADYQSIG